MDHKSMMQNVSSHLDIGYAAVLFLMRDTQLVVHHVSSTNAVAHMDNAVHLLCAGAMQRSENEKVFVLVRESDGVLLLPYKGGSPIFDLYGNRIADNTIPVLKIGDHVLFDARWFSEENQ